LRAKGVHHTIGHDWHRTRPFVEAEVVAIRRRVAVLPLCLAGRRVHRLDDFAVRHALKEDDAALDDDGPAEALTDRAARNDARSPGAPGVAQRSDVHAIALGTEELRPVCGDELRSYGERRHRRGEE